MFEANFSQQEENKKFANHPSFNLNLKKLGEWENSNKLSWGVFIDKPENSSAIFMVFSPKRIDPKNPDYQCFPHLCNPISLQQNNRTFLEEIRKTAEKFTQFSKKYHEKFSSQKINVRNIP